MKSFEYVTPSTVAQAIEATTKGAQFKAGGIDLLDMLKSQIATPNRVVNLKEVAELKGINVDDKGASIGALATLAQIASHEGLQKRYRALALAAGEAATPQIRNVATIGGNLLQRPRCWYYRLPQFHCLKKGGDTCFAIAGENKFHAIFETSPCPIVHPSNTAVALSAFGAVLQIVGRSGTRQVPIEKFFVREPARENVLVEGELIARIDLPPVNAPSHYIEFREKQSFDWALVSAAAVGRPKAVRIVLGSVAPVPWLVKVTSFEPSEAGIAVAAKEAVKGATPLEQNKYKVRMAEIAVKRALMGLTE